MGDLEELKLRWETLRKLRRKNDTTNDELMQIKEMELSHQRCKDQLMQRRKRVASSIQNRCTAVEDLTAGLPASSRRLFNQLYPQVDEVYQLELLLLELKQQLMVAMATREEETILKALRDESFKRKNHCDVSGDTSILQKWFQQISCVKREADPDMNPGRTSNDERRIYRDRVFYWAKYEILPYNLSSRQQVLSFSTRHYGMCIQLCIKAPIIAEGTPLSFPHTYTISSNIPLEGLQLGLQHSIEKKEMAREFVINTVWRLMENNLLPLMST